MSIVRIDDADIYYERNGDSGDPLVLVHGSWVDHHNWDAVVPTLSKTFRVLAYDRRGHSRSRRPAESATMQEHVADLAGLIEHLGLKPAYVAGNSLGGSIALRLAAERPELIRSAAVHEPPLLGLLRDEPGKANMLEKVRSDQEAVLELLRAGDRERAGQRFIETMAFGPGAWRRLSPEGRETMVRNAQTFLDESADPDGFTIDRATLARIHQPVLVTESRKSPGYLPAIAGIVAKTLPNVTVRTFTASGHAPQISHAAEFVKTITEFLNPNPSYYRGSSAE